MKKVIVIILMICLLLTGCSIKAESSITEDNSEYTVLLNGKKHLFKISEEETKKSNKKVTIYMDDEDILGYTRVYSENELWDFEFVKLVKGTDKKYYLVYALSNWTGSKYKQYLLIFNDEGNVIYKNDNNDFGLAFTEYSDVESYPMDSMYGDTGMTKIEEDKIIYLTDFSYDGDVEYVRCQENIITINDSKITETKGSIIKTGRVS